MMKKLILGLSALAVAAVGVIGAYVWLSQKSSASQSALSLEGEYQGSTNNGFMTVKQVKGNLYKVWLGVGAGSCGGESLVDQELLIPASNEAKATWKNEQNECLTTISFHNGGASVSDSCIKEEDEEHNTCALLGDYTKASGGT